MPARAKQASPVADANEDAGHTHDFQSFVLARVATAGGATRSSISRDLQPYVSHKLSPGEWRQLCDSALQSLKADGLATESRGRLLATESGIERARAYLNLKAATPPTWQMQRDVALIAKALGIENESPAKLTALARPDGLRAMIVQKAFGLPIRKNISPAKLRAGLALVALEKAFGNKIKSTLGPKSALPAKVSLALASQLADQSRTFTSDSQLIAQLAADAVGARQTSLDELRLMILRNFTTALLDKTSPTEMAKNSGKAQEKPTGHKKTKPKKAKPQPKKKLPPALTPANDTQPPAETELEMERPDVAEFARVVNSLASDVAEGWPGNFKAFISRVWSAIRDRYPQWNLSEIEFKCMLVEAHRTGKVVLAGADLKNKKDIAEFESSAISYKNTVWHFIRVEH